MLQLTFKYIFVLVWLVNGLFCKIVGWAPRHRDIVGTILGHEYALLLTHVIGLGEIFLAAWILSEFKARWCSWVQVILVITMNVIEWNVTPHLLLFGKWNMLIALLFAISIMLNEYIFRPVYEQQPRGHARVV